MSRTINGVYEFGPFRMDLQGRVLTRGDHVLHLPPKTFDLLTLLVQNPGRAFSRQELLSALWPDTFVEEANLSFQISVLRKALGEDGARWVETVPKHGYRFGADVRTTTPPPAPVREESPGTSDAQGGRPTRGISPTPGLRTLWLAGATVVAALLAALTWLIAGREPPDSRTPPALAVPLTAYRGFERTPSLSPDASRVAFSWNGRTPDNHDIYVKVAGPGEPVPLTTDPARDESPAWSPDSRRIAFLRFTSSTAADLVVIPALGGAEKTVATIFPVPIPPTVRPITNLSWTPDGRWLAFGGSTSPGGPQGIWLIAVDDGSQQRRLTEPREGVLNHHSPAVSPDGRHLAYLQTRAVGRMGIVLVPLTADLAPGGSARQVTDDTVLGFAWTPDGRELVFSGGGHLGLSRIAKIPVAPHASRPPAPEFLTFGERATGISIAASGRLVYSAQLRDTTLYELALAGTPGTPVPLAAGFASTYDEHTPHVSPDGQRLAFASTRSGSEEIWIAARDGSNPVQVTSMGGPQCSTPQWSPDGGTILFNSRRAGSADLYLLRPDTGTITRLTDHPAEEAEARWSRDGRWIYFGSNRTGRLDVWRMPAGGGEATQITRQGGVAAIESGDGFLYYAKEAHSPTSIWRVRVEGGAEEPVIDGLTYSLNFAVGERGLYLVAAGDTADKPSVDFFDFAIGRRSTLVRLDKPFWFGMTVSPGERSLVFPLVDSAGSDLMLVEEFR